MESAFFHLVTSGPTSELKGKPHEVIIAKYLESKELSGTYSCKAGSHKCKQHWCDAEVHLDQSPTDDVGDPSQSSTTNDGTEDQAEAGDSINLDVTTEESFEQIQETLENVASEEESARAESVELNPGVEEHGSAEIDNDDTQEDTGNSAEGEVFSEEAPDLVVAPSDIGLTGEQKETAEEEPSKEVAEGDATEEQIKTEESGDESVEEIKSEGQEETPADEPASEEAEDESHGTGETIAEDTVTEEDVSDQDPSKQGETAESLEEPSEGESTETGELDKTAGSLEDDNKSVEESAAGVTKEEDAEAASEKVAPEEEDTAVDESQEAESKSGEEEEKVASDETEETVPSEEDNVPEDGTRSTEEESAEEIKQTSVEEETQSLEESATKEELQADGKTSDEVSQEATASLEEPSDEHKTSAEEEVKPDESSEDKASNIAEESKSELGAEKPIIEQTNTTTTEEIEVEVHEEGEKESEQPSEPESPEEELTMEIEIPKNLRSREHMAQILQLNEETAETEKRLSKIADNTLRELKKLYDAAIKPLEILYKYRDLSNRHFGDPEIFSKPLVLFMGPWSGGKSTIINYLLENEYKNTALRTGAEPSPAYFNIVMWGEQEEVLDGTQLAADWTFSGLQKFGQGLLDRLRGLKLNHPLLEKVNIVEIPGILEIRKQVERLFPFNDACQWFIDRADIIFLVYDPSKLDVGPESEAILDQLKGREMQTRIILNKADQVRPEELMRVQGVLIWNISPLMSSTEPPVMYSTSLWSSPYESGAPTRLLYAQERAFLRDLREAMNKRVENKIASARRFAVRVRNHAKMVDCYLTTYYNHKSFFGNKKKVSDDIIEHPQNYHIYEGLSTLTNISRYDLPDPDVYRDFFRLNPVYEFQQLASTCTYFRGCPINRLDVAIAYDLPELVGKYKKAVEEVTSSKK